MKLKQRLFLRCLGIFMLSVIPSVFFYEVLYLHTHIQLAIPQYFYKGLRYSENEVLTTVITLFNSSKCSSLRNVSTTLSLLTMRVKWVIVTSHSLEETCPYTLYQHTIVTKSTAKEQWSARQIAFDMVVTKYFIFLDQSDSLSPPSVEKALWVLEHDSRLCVCGWLTQEFGFRSKQLRVGYFYGSKGILENKLPASQLVKTSLARKCKARFRNLPYGMEVWDFWLQLANCGMLGYSIPTSDFFHKVYPENEEERLLIESSIQFKEEVNELKQRYAYLESSYPPKYEAFTKNSVLNLYTRTSLITCNYVQKKAYNHSCSVVLFTPYMGVGGSEAFALRAIKAMVNDKRCKVAVLTDIYDYPSSEVLKAEWEKITPDIFELPTFATTKTIFEFIRYIFETRKVTNVFINNCMLGYKIVYYLKILYPNVQMSAYVHSITYGEIAMKHVRGLDLIVTSSMALKRRLVEKYGNAKIVRVAYIGVHVWTNKDIAMLKNQVYKYVNNDKKIFRIMFIGRMSVEKSPITFVNVVDEVYKRVQHTHNVYVDICGTGPLRRMVQKEIEKSLVNDVLTYHGNIKAARTFVCGASLLIMTSIIEGIPYVMLEAMACGVPVLSTNVGGIPSVISNKTNGFMCNVGDIECFVSITVYLILNPLMAKAVGKAALLTVRRKFNESKNFPLIVDMLTARKKKEDAGRQTLDHLQLLHLREAMDTAQHAWGSDGSTRTFFGITKLLEAQSKLYDFKSID